MIARSLSPLSSSTDLKSRTDVPKKPVSNEYPKFQLEKPAFPTCAKTPLTSLGKVSLSVHN
jgi:hypothetical protein